MRLIGEQILEDELCTFAQQCSAYVVVENWIVSFKRAKLSIDEDPFRRTVFGTLS